MSRLEELQKKQFRRNIIAAGVILALLVVFIFMFGFKTLINATIFVTNMTSSKKTQTEEQKTTKYGLLDIDEIPVATNSARIVVSGTVNNYDVLYFYVNDEQVKEKKINSEDFVEEIGDLKKGRNTVYVKARANDSKEEKKSEVFDIMYRADKPKLEISEPQVDTKTSNSEIKVAGKTDSEVLIKVNDFPVVVDAQGGFQTTVRLHEGENMLDIKAIDDAGNTETKTLKVNYQKDN